MLGKPVYLTDGAHGDDGEVKLAPGPKRVCLRPCADVSRSDSFSGNFLLISFCNSTNTRPRIVREVTTFFFPPSTSQKMADDGSHGRAWPSSDADLTNSVCLCFTMPLELVSSFMVCEDP